MKKAIIFVTLLLLAGQITWRTPAKANDNGPTEVIIFAGQSNMVGGGIIRDAPDGLFPMPDAVEFHDFSRNSKYVPSTGHFGPEASFSHALVSAHPDKKYIFVKWAVGGTSQFSWSPDWSADAPMSERAAMLGPLYRKAIADITKVLGKRDVRVTAMIWMQGESDTRKIEYANAFAGNMRNLVNAFMRDLGASNMHVIMGLINPVKDLYVYVPEVRAQMLELAASNSLIAVVSTDGVSKRPDNVHYDTDGQIELGKRFATQFLAMENQP